MSVLFFCSDLHISTHAERYTRLLPILSKNKKIIYTYFPLPLYVHLIADNPENINYLVSNLSSIEGLKALQQLPDPLMNFQCANLKSIQAYDLIQETTLGHIVTTILSLEPCNLDKFEWRGLQIFKYVRRDISLCLKNNTSDLSTITNPAHIDFVKLTFIATALSVEVANTILVNEKFNSIKIDRCILPDAYSAYNAVAARLNKSGAKTMILTADAHFNKLLKIMPTTPHLLNLAVHNAQQIAHEYTSPENMFSLAKVYLEEKVIKGFSSQAYSSAESESNEQLRVEEFIRYHPKCLAYFTSSPDEQTQDIQKYPAHSLQSGELSRGSSLFSDEYEMLSDLVEHSRQNDYGLIIRMHPRLGSEKRSLQVSTARKSFFCQINSLDKESKERILIIEPEAKLSSYWLGAQATVNIFYRSSIGTELSILGFPSISPQHLDSFTYQGHYHETAMAPASIVEWHQQIQSVLVQGFSYYLHLAVRGFFIQRFSSTFVVDTAEACKDFVPSTSKESFISLQIPNVEELCMFVEACSSFSLPKEKGYWNLSDYIPGWKSYMRWLLSTAYPALGVSRSIAVHKIRVQSKMFHNALFESFDT